MTGYLFCYMVFSDKHFIRKVLVFMLAAVSLSFLPFFFLRNSKHHKPTSKMVEERFSLFRVLANISHFPTNLNRLSEAGSLFSLLLVFLILSQKAALGSSSSLHVDLQEPCLLLILFFDLTVDDAHY